MQQPPVRAGLHSEGEAPWAMPQGNICRAHCAHLCIVLLLLNSCCQLLCCLRLALQGADIASQLLHLRNGGDRRGRICGCMSRLLLAGDVGSKLLAILARVQGVGASDADLGRSWRRAVAVGRGHGGQAEQLLGSVQGAGGWGGGGGLPSPNQVAPAPPSQAPSQAVPSARPPLLPAGLAVAAARPPGLPCQPRTAPAWPAGRARHN